MPQNKYVSTISKHIQSTYACAHMYGVKKWKDCQVSLVNLAQEAG